MVSGQWSIVRELGNIYPPAFRLYSVFNWKFKAPQFNQQGSQNFVFHRNAVLPKFMTWLNQVGTEGPRLKFPGTSPVYCHENCLAPLLLKT